MTTQDAKARATKVMPNQLDWFLMNQFFTAHTEDNPKPHHKGLKQYVDGWSDEIVLFEMNKGREVKFNREHIERQRKRLGIYLDWPNTDEGRELMLKHNPELRPKPVPPAEPKTNKSVEELLADWNADAEPTPVPASLEPVRNLAWALVEIERLHRKVGHSEAERGVERAMMTARVGKMQSDVDELGKANNNLAARLAKQERFERDVRSQFGSKLKRSL